jgi:tetratricopeptide (TPR) repeat protein
LGAAYLVLGIAYYRNDLMKDGLEAFERALRIFEPLDYKDWLGQIYSWRGALYQDEREKTEENLKKTEENLKKAEEDLKKSLEIGPSSIKAMTLNRLARVYMSQKRWDEAEEYMQKSLDAARKIPDRVYELGSIGRLASIASEKGQFDRFDEFKKELEEYFKKVDKNWDANSKGIAYLGLAKLGLGQQDHSKLPLIIEYLKEGISLVTTHGSYARTDVVTRLKEVEKCFPMADSQMIHDIGTELRKHFAEKMTTDMDFIVVTQIMDKWSKWK